MQERTNQQWIEQLTGEAPSEAINDLRDILLNGLRYSLSTKLSENDFHALIEDFVQDALIKILQNIHTFRGESKFITWAQKITIRVAFTELRRQRWKDISLDNLVPEDSLDFTPNFLADKTNLPEQAAAQQQILEWLTQLINEELSDKQKKAIIAVMIHKVPLEEVARRMNSNRNALYKLIHDARKKLKTRLLADGTNVDELLAIFD